MAAKWIKYIVLARYISTLPIRQKRLAFACMRQTENATPELFIPSLGITAGEFCAFHALALEQPNRKSAAAK